MRSSIPVGFAKNALRASVIAAFALAALGFASAVSAADDPIVGTWVGKLAQPENDPFETRVTFVSPNGGISRYPEFPCGGVLTGGRKGDGYEYDEAISWGGVEEVDPGCLSGAVKVTLDGDKMNFSWSGTYNGQQFQAAGELKRERKGKQ